MKNIISYDLNDECCGVVESNGKIRILKKNKQGSCKTYLQLENELSEQMKKKNEVVKKVSLLKQKNLLISALVIVIALFILNTSLVGINAIVAYLSFVSFSGLLTFNIVSIINTLKNKKDINKEIDDLKKEIKKLKKDIVLFNENVFIYEPELRYELEDNTLKDIIKESIGLLYLYVIQNCNGEVNNNLVNYYDNDIISFDECMSCFKHDLASSNYGEGNTVEPSKTINYHELKQDLTELLVYENEEERQKELKLVKRN